MSLKVINYICCPNGFGHFKRFISLNENFQKNNLKVNLYTNEDAWIKFIKFNKYKFLNIRVINRNFPTYNIDKNKTCNFFKSLSLEIDENLIISDNYEEICFFKKNVILLSNFFWNITNNDKSYLKNLFLNMKKNDCLLFGNLYFSAKYIKNNSNFNGLGFFGKKIKPNKRYDKNKILFVKGFGSYKNNFERKIFDIYEKFPNKKNLIFDCNINFAQRKKLKIATQFNEKLFSSLKLIIGRPSFGILTDAIARNIPFLPLSDIKDKESMETKSQFFSFFDQNDNIEDYIEASLKKYDKNFFKFNAENKLFKIILDLL